MMMVMLVVARRVSDIDRHRRCVLRAAATGRRIVGKSGVQKNGLFVSNVLALVLA